MTTVSEKLLSLRKEHGFSQEYLAGELGISRQAISKWERGETLPNTESLMALSVIYGVSVDELLCMNADEKPQENIPVSNNMTFEQGFVPTFEDCQKEEIKSYNFNSLMIGFEKIFETDVFRFVFTSYPIIVTAVYLFFGAVFHLWAYAWLVFMTIPLFYTAVQAIKKRNANIFCYPVLVATIYLAMGMAFRIWTMTLFLFFTIPIYYIAIATLIRKK